jgi:hypothetical protein
MRRPLDLGSIGVPWHCSSNREARGEKGNPAGLIHEAGGLQFEAARHRTVAGLGCIALEKLLARLQYTTTVASMAPSRYGAR